MPFKLKDLKNEGWALYLVFLPPYIISTHCVQGCARQACVRTSSLFYILLLAQMCKIAGICGTSFSALLFARQSYISHIPSTIDTRKELPKRAMYLGKKRAGCQSRFAVKNGKKQFLTCYWFVQYGTSEGPEGFQTDPK